MAGLKEVRKHSSGVFGQMSSVNIYILISQKGHELSSPVSCHHNLLCYQAEDYGADLGLKPLRLRKKSKHFFIYFIPLTYIVIMLETDINSIVYFNECSLINQFSLSVSLFTTEYSWLKQANHTLLASKKN